MAQLNGVTGICNANYKVVSQAGQLELRLFEINPRVGGDLGTDVPRDRAAAFLRRLDELGGGTAEPLQLDESADNDGELPDWIPIESL